MPDHASSARSRRPRCSASPASSPAIAETWRALAQHHPDERWFTRLAAHDDHDVWLIGWDSFQGVDLHDHGGSSRRAVRGRGRAAGDVDPSARRAFARSEQRLAAGTARAFGPGHVHRVVNPSAAVATSVHVYSPPLVDDGLLRRRCEWHAGAHAPRAALGARSGRGELR